MCSPSNEPNSIFLAPILLETALLIYSPAGLHWLQAESRENHIPYTGRVKVYEIFVMQDYFFDGTTLFDRVRHSEMKCLKGLGDTLVTNAQREIMQNGTGRKSLY